MKNSYPFTICEKYAAASIVVNIKKGLKLLMLNDTLEHMMNFFPIERNRNIIEIQ